MKSAGLLQTEMPEEDLLALYHMLQAGWWELMMGTINFYHFMSLSVTLTLAGGHKFSGKQYLLVSFSHTLVKFSWAGWNMVWCLKQFKFNSCVWQRCLSRSVPEIHLHVALLKLGNQPTNCWAGWIKGCKMLVTSVGHGLVYLVPINHNFSSAVASCHLISELLLDSAVMN